MPTAHACVFFFMLFPFRLVGTMTSNVLTVPNTKILFSPPTRTVGSNSLREIILNLIFDIHGLHSSALMHHIFIFVD